MMGQKEMTMTVTTEEKGGGTLRRILLVLALVILVAVMILAMSAPGFSKPINSCDASSFESKCNQGPTPQVNFGDNQSNIVTTSGGQAASENSFNNPSTKHGPFLLRSCTMPSCT